MFHKVMEITAHMPQARALSSLCHTLHTYDIMNYVGNTSCATHVVQFGLSLVKDKKRAGRDKRKADGVIPVERFPQIPNGKDRKDGERDYFLNGFEFRGRELSVP